MIPCLATPVGVNLVAVRLETADDRGRLLPVPEAYGRIAAACPDFLGEDFVQCHVQVRGQHCGGNDVPVVVGPGRGLGQCPARGDGYCVRGEPEHHRVRGQRGLHGCGDLRRRRAFREPLQRRVDVQQRLIRFEEEIAADGDTGEGAVGDVEVHHHELAPRHLVLPVKPGGAVVVCRKWRASHAFHPAPETQKARTVAGAGFPKNLGEK